MSTGPQHFSSDKKLIAFARQFIGNQVQRFRKDIAVCLTGVRRKNQKALTHAYFPALITCIAFNDLLSGLNAGKLEFHGLKELLEYAKRFMSSYDETKLKIMYLCFRHKVAHLSHPYAVFDTDTKRRDFATTPRMRVVWTVCASRRKPAIELTKLPTTTMRRTPTPWAVTYDHRVKVNIQSFASDIVKSIYGPQGYLKHLESDAGARRRFEMCMNEFYRV